MPEYLDAYRRILPESERGRLEQLLAVGPPEAQLSEEEIRRIVEGVLDNRLTMTLRPQGKMTDALSLNATLKELWADLSLLYEQSKQIGQAIDSHYSLHSGFLEQIEKGVARLERQLQDVAILADGQGYSHAVTDSFQDESLTQVDRTGKEHLFTDGYSIIEHNARIQDGDLFLAPSEEKSLLRDETGTTAAVEVLLQSASAYRDENPVYGPHAAIDGSPDTYWAEVILSPSVIKMPMAGVDRGAVTQILIRFARPGVMSAVKIDPIGAYPMELVSVAAVTAEGSQRIVLPYDPAKPRFIKQPTVFRFQGTPASAAILTFRQVHADRIAYTLTRQTAASREFWQKLVAVERGLVESAQEGDLPPDALERMRTEAIKDPAWEAYLELTRKYMKSENVKDFGAVAGAIALSVLTGLPVMSILSALGIREELRERPPEPPEIVQEERYLYVYGARSIDILGIDYAPASVHVSIPYEIPDNIRQIALDVQETHPEIYGENGRVTKTWFGSSGAVQSIGLPLRRTSVEYYVAAMADDHLLSWQPILPLDQEEVDTEFLHIGFAPLEAEKVSLAPGEPYAITRFPIDTSRPVRLYRDEQPVPVEYWRIADGPKGLPQVIVLDRRLFHAKSVYTVDYTPAGNPHIVDTLVGGAVPRRKVEDFDGATRNGTVTLSYKPYVDRAKLIADETANTFTYNPVQVILNPVDHPSRNPEIHRIMGPNRAITDPIYSTRDPNGLAGAQARLLNVTRYDSDEWPLLKAYDPLGKPPTFEYFHSGRQVFFPESFRHATVDNPSSHGQAIIRVIYEYLTTGVVLKIVLRRSPIDPSLTPVVHHYSLRFRTT